MLPFYNRESIKELREVALPNICQITNEKMPIDTLNYLTKTGNYPKERLEQRKDSLLLNLTPFADAGANPIQQVGYALSQVEEYLKKYPRPRQITIIVGVSPYVFFEVPKLIALRIAFKTYMPMVGVRLVAQSSQRYNHIRMLKMWEVLSGAIASDAVAVEEKDTEDCQKIATHFSGAGFEKTPYFISIANQIYDKAIDLYREISNSGGYVAHLRKGTIQKKVKENSKKEGQYLNAEFQYANQDKGKTLVEALSAEKMKMKDPAPDVQIHYGGKYKRQEFPQIRDWAGFEPYSRGLNPVWEMPKQVEVQNKQIFDFKTTPLEDLDKARLRRTKTWMEKEEKAQTYVEINNQNIVSLPVILSCGVESVGVEDTLKEAYDLAEKFINPHTIDPFSGVGKL